MRRFSWVPSLPLFKSPETWLSQRPRCWGRFHCQSSGPAVTGEQGTPLQMNCCLGWGTKHPQPPTPVVENCSRHGWQTFKKYHVCGCLEWDVQNNFNVQLLLHCLFVFYKGGGGGGSKTLFQPEGFYPWIAWTMGNWPAPFGTSGFQI